MIALNPTHNSAFLLVGSATCHHYVIINESQKLNWDISRNKVSGFVVIDLVIICTIITIRFENELHNYSSSNTAICRSNEQELLLLLLVAYTYSKLALLILKHLQNHAKFNCNKCPF